MPPKVTKKELQKLFKEKGFLDTWKQYSAEISDIYFDSKSKDEVSKAFQDLLLDDAEVSQHVLAASSSAKELYPKVESEYRLEHQATMASFASRLAPKSFEHPVILEGDGSKMKYYFNRQFQNWGRTVDNTPTLTFVPKTIAGVSNLVLWARENKKKVRCAGYRHSWSNIFSEKDEVLISLLPLEYVEGIDDKDIKMDPHNELQGVKVIDGKEGTPAHIRVGAGTTNEMFREWCLSKDGGNWRWCIPFNVILVEVTFGGVNAPICHGAGLKHQTLSDLVTEIEFVNALGKVQTVNDPKLLQAASGCFGLLGVVTALTFKFPAMTIAKMIPHKQPVALTIPPPDYKVPSEISKYINMSGITVDEMKKAYEKLVLNCETNYYVEYFWFTMNENCWINCWNDDGDPKLAKDYPSKADIEKQKRQEWLGQIFVNDTVFKALPPVVQCELFASNAMNQLPHGEPVITPVSDALHFRRGIHIMQARDMEIEVPIPPRADDPTKPDWSIVQKLWWDVIVGVYKRRAIYDNAPWWDLKTKYDGKTAPMRLTMEMRIFRDSNVTMAPVTGNKFGTCSIEILSTMNGSNEEWLEFMQEIVDKWASYKNPDGSFLNVRPHWAKEWQGLEIRKKPIKAHLKEIAYKDQIPEFKKKLADIAQIGGYSLIDLATFSNPLLEEIFEIAQEVKTEKAEIAPHAKPRALALRDRKERGGIHDYTWTNYGKNLSAKVITYYEPSSTKEVQTIVKLAAEKKVKISVVGDSHSWSPICVTDGYMICTKKLDKIIEVTKKPPRISLEPGVTVGDTLKAYKEHGVTLPMNVDVPTITIGGAVSVGANGFSKNYGTYSEYVYELEVVDGHGEVQTINKDKDPELLKAAACSLGLFGVITKITLDLVPMFNVRVINKKIPSEEALAGFSTAFKSHDYVQYFWFPFNSDVLMQTSDVTEDKVDLPFGYNFNKELNGWGQAIGSYLIHGALTSHPHWTRTVCKLAFDTLPVNNYVMQQPDNVMLTRAIDSYFPSENCSVSFPPGDDAKYVRQAWNDAANLINEMAKEDKYPVNLEMNTRLFGESSPYLCSLPDVKGHICNIQVTSLKNKHWAEFKTRMMELWMKIPNARPHWAKEFQGVPKITQQIRQVYGTNLEAFKKAREASKIDPAKVFVNPFLDELFFA